MTGIVIGDAPFEPPARRLRFERRRDIRSRRAPWRRTRAARSRVRRLVGEQFAVFLERRTAAGGVDDDRVDAVRARSARSARARSAWPRRAGRECSESAPQQPWPGGTTTSQPSAAQHAHRRRVDVAGKNARCTQPATRPTRARAGRSSRRRERRHVAAQVGERERRQQRVELREPRAAAHAAVPSAARALAARSSHTQTSGSAQQRAAAPDTARARRSARGTRDRAARAAPRVSTFARVDSISRS